MLHVSVPCCVRSCSPHMSESGGGSGRFEPNFNFPSLYFSTTASIKSENVFGLYFCVVCGVGGWCGWCVWWVWGGEREKGERRRKGEGRERREREKGERRERDLG